MYAVPSPPLHPDNVMHDSRRDRATGPKEPAGQPLPDHDVETELKSALTGRSARARTGTAHPVDRVYALLGNGTSTDEYLEKIRGR